MLKFLFYTFFFATTAVVAVAEISKKSSTEDFVYEKDGTVTFI